MRGETLCNACASSDGGHELCELQRFTAKSVREAVRLVESQLADSGK